MRIRRSIPPYFIFQSFVYIIYEQGDICMLYEGLSLAQTSPCTFPKRRIYEEGREVFYITSNETTLFLAAKILSHISFLRTSEPKTMLDILSGSEEINAALISEYKSFPGKLVIAEAQPELTLKEIEQSSQKEKLTVLQSESNQNPRRLTITSLKNIWNPCASYRVFLTLPTVHSPDKVFKVF